MPTGLELVPFDNIVMELRNRFPAFLLVIEFQPELQRMTNLRFESHESRSTCQHSILGMAHYAAAMVTKTLADTSQRLPSGSPLDGPGKSEKAP